MIHASQKYNEGHINTIPEDEPVFLLRAQDITAAATVAYWISLQPDDSPLIPPVRRHILRMNEWPMKHVAGPDLEDQ